MRCCCLLAHAAAQKTIQASTGFSSHISSFSIISTPAFAKEFIAPSQASSTSLSTVENPIVDDQIAVFGKSSFN